MGKYNIVGTVKIAPNKEVYLSKVDDGIVIAVYKQFNNGTKGFLKNSIFIHKNDIEEFKKIVSEV